MSDENIKQLSISLVNLAKRVRNLETLPRVSAVTVAPDGGHIIQEEGSDLAQELHLNFIGDGVTATDNAGTGATDVTIPGGGGHVIQEEGGDLTQRVHLNFIGDGVTATDNAGTDATDVTIPGGSYANNIVLIDPGVEAVILYDPDDAGLAAAIAAAGSGDSIQLGLATYANAYTIPAGVRIYGFDRFGCVFTNQITGAGGAKLENCSIVRTANNGSVLKGVVAPASGSFRMDDVTIGLTQAGSGDAYGISIDSGSCAMECQNCYVTSESGSGLGYAAYREPLIAASLYLYGGRYAGSSFPFNE